MYQREKAFLIKTAYLAAVLAVGWLILRYALVWLLPFLLALGFAALMEPAITLARRKLRLKRGFLAAVLTLALLALVIALGAVLVGQVIRQATDLMERLPELLSALPVLADRITARLRSFCAGCPEGLQQWVTQLLERLEQLLASGEARSISAATRSVDLSRSAFYKYKDCIFDSENGREVITVMATLRDETGALQSLLAGISAAGASIVTINQSTPENGAALVAVTIRTDTMQMTPEELTEKLSRQRMVVGVHCGYNL